MNFTLLGARPLYIFVSFVLGRGCYLEAVCFSPSCYALGGKTRAHYGQSPSEFSTQCSRNYEVFLSDRSRNYSRMCVSFQYHSLEPFQVFFSLKKKKKKFFLWEFHTRVLISTQLTTQGDPLQRFVLLSVQLFLHRTLPWALWPLSVLGLSALSPQLRGYRQAPPGFPCSAA